MEQIITQIVQLFLALIQDVLLDWTSTLLGLDAIENVTGMMM